MIERVDPAIVSQGEIVLVARNRRLFAHRLKSNQMEAGIVTQGDAMSTPDPRVDKVNLLGRVSFIIRNGRQIQPRPNLRISERALATLLQHSEAAARIVVGIHGFRQPFASQNS